VPSGLGAGVLVGVGVSVGGFGVGVGVRVGVAAGVGVGDGFAAGPPFPQLGKASTSTMMGSNTHRNLLSDIIEPPRLSVVAIQIYAALFQAHTGPSSTWLLGHHFRGQRFKTQHV